MPLRFRFAISSLAPRQLALWLGAWLSGLLLGSALWIAQSMDRSLNAFETDARIAHRLLSQRAVQHEAVLATLSLMQPALDARLPAIYPQFLQMWRKEPGQAWPADSALATALAAAELRSCLLYTSPSPRD